MLLWLNSQATSDFDLSEGMVDMDGGIGLKNMVGWELLD